MMVKCIYAYFNSYVLITAWLHRYIFH